MGKSGRVGIVVLVALLVAVLVALKKESNDEPDEAVAAGEVRMPDRVAPPLPEPKEDLSGDYMGGYGNPAESPERDAMLVWEVIEGFLISVKVPDALPMGENREITRALFGDNPYRMRFLDPSSGFLNDEDELLDRWGVPLFFHFVEAGEVGIRSAGPDRVMWSEDDVTYGDHVDAAE